MYPKHIPNQDAYTKRTGLWVGGGFHQLPPQRRIDPTFKEWTEGSSGKRKRVTPILYSGGAGLRLAAAGGDLSLAAVSPRFVVTGCNPAGCNPASASSFVRELALI